MRTILALIMKPGHVRMGYRDTMHDRYGLGMGRDTLTTTEADAYWHGRRMALRKMGW